MKLINVPSLFIYLPIYSLLIIICRSFISTYIVLSSYIRSFMVHSFHKAASTSACTTKTEVVEVEVHLCTTSLQHYNYNLQLQSTSTSTIYTLQCCQLLLLLSTLFTYNFSFLHIFHISIQLSYGLTKRSSILKSGLKLLPIS